MFERFVCIVFSSLHQKSKNKNSQTPHSRPDNPEAQNCYTAFAKLRQPRPTDGGFGRKAQATAKRASANHFARLGLRIRCSGRSPDEHRHPDI